MDRNTSPFWKLTAFQGEFKLYGFYREEQRELQNITDNQKYSLYSGGLKLQTKSYIWNPKFMKLEVDGEYNPQKISQHYLITPEQSELITMKNLHIRSVLFSEKKIIITLFANIGNVYTTRENLSSVRTNSISYGGAASFANKFLPASLNFNKTKWTLTEIETGRTYNFDQTSLQAFITKSFSKNDKNDLSFSHNDIANKQLNFAAMRNINDLLNLNDTYYLNKAKTGIITSNINNISQSGVDTYNNFQSFQNLTYILPYEFRFTGGNNFSNINRKASNIKQNSTFFSLGNKIYESLNYDISYDYHNVSQTGEHEVNSQEGFNINYEKKIPTKGHFTLSYGYSRNPYNISGTSQFIKVKNEAYYLLDGLVKLLNKPYIDIASVVVKDFPGTTIFQLNFDYILIKRNNFIEIQRIPGGLIPNNSTVYIDYTYTQPGSFKYTLINKNFSAGLGLFNNVLQLYYNSNTQNFTDIQLTDVAILNYVEQKIYGTRIDFKQASAGVEYNQYKSNVIPYNLIRYYFLFSGSFYNRFIYSLNGNLRYYKMLNDQKNQNYSDLSVMLGYTLNIHSKISGNISYRNQTGYQIGLNLLTARAEYTATYGKLNIKFGVESYNREYLSENINYKGIFAELSRRF